jgi:uncharacterized protein (TIGR00251 family)
MIPEHVNRLAVHVKPNCSKTEILSYDDNKNLLTIMVKAPADKNMANMELLRFLTKETGKKARIKSGRTSKVKIIEFC